MSTLPEIEAAIRQLSSTEIEQLRGILDEMAADEADRQFEKDILSGKFDELAQRAREEFRAGRTTPL